jgi:ATP-binding cassette subfamily C protein CydCD
MKKLLLAILLSAASLLSAITLLGTSAWLISMASTRPPVMVLEVAIVGVRTFGLGRGVLKYTSRILEHQGALTIQSNLRVRIYENFLAMKISQLLDIRKGATLQQVVNDVETLQDLWLRVGSPWASALLAGCAGITITYYLLPSAGLILGGLFLFAALIVPIFSSFAAGSRQQRKLESEIFYEILQTSELIEESLVFGFSKDLISQIGDRQNQIARIERSNAKRAGLGAALYIKWLGLAVVTMIIFALNAFQAGRLAGVNVAVIILLPLAIFDGLTSLPVAFSHLAQILDARAALKPNLKKIIFETPVISDHSHDHCTLELREVRPMRAGVTLSSFTGVAQPGHPLIIQGKSGGGKSSLLSALVGEIKFSGQVNINYEELTNFDPGIFTTMLQDDHLFATSIRENIKIGNPNASDREIEQILEIVELADLLHTLPDGLDTLVGNLGYNFSGGEKQRIKLARMLMRNTPIYLLDEPFEYLDHFQADRLTKKVLKFLSTKTIVMVSHTY